jgi:hypothetical protein
MAQESKKVIVKRFSDQEAVPMTIAPGARCRDILAVLGEWEALSLVTVPGPGLLILAHASVWNWVADGTTVSVVRSGCPGGVPSGVASASAREGRHRQSLEGRGMKEIAVKVSGSDQEPFEVHLQPGMTAGEILEYLGLAGYVLVSASKPTTYVLPDLDLFREIQDGEKLYAVSTRYTAC